MEIFFLISEKIKEAIQNNYKNVLENIEPNSVVETLSKVKGIPDMKYIIPESRKSRIENADIVLSNVFNDDSCVLELRNYFRQNDLDYLIKE